MALYGLDAVEIFGRDVLKAEGVVVDKEGNVYGGETGGGEMESGLTVTQNEERRRLR
ncbi:MAG: hypothetical protein HY268_28675 [Deltaproteobacteria bacterium]|nr:hypothetical protein [Deltaproteobacteria bacterium]